MAYSAQDRVHAYWLLRQWRSRIAQDIDRTRNQMTLWRRLRSINVVSDAIDGIHKQMRTFKGE
jgi:hypothetical protein